MKYIALIIYSLTALAGISQTKEVNQIQPKIVVVPKVKSGDDIRAILEQSPNLRTAISIVKKSFDQRGFTTYDFMEALKQAEAKRMRNTANNTLISKNEILNGFTKAEIEVEIDFIELTPNSQGKEVRINLQAYMVGEASSLANAPCQSKRLNVEIIDLTQQAIDKDIDGFMSTLQAKFTEIVTNGVSYLMEFQISGDQSFLFSDEIATDGEQFSYLIYDWIRNNAYKNYATLDDESETALTFTVKLPLRDPVTGMNYQMKDFERNLRQFFKSKGYDCKSSKNEGKVLYLQVFKPQL
jgi:hypothetical protein